MNDEFLYQLRKQPPERFASRLKVRLESQAIDDEYKKRTHRWLALIVAFLAGGVAFALVVPSARDTIRAWLAGPDETPFVQATSQTTTQPQSPTTIGSPRPAATAATIAEVGGREQAVANDVQSRSAGAVQASGDQTVVAREAPPTIIGVQTRPLSANKLSVAHDRLTTELSESLAAEWGGGRESIGIELTKVEEKKFRCETLRARAADLFVTTVRMSDAETKQCRRSGFDYQEIILAYEPIVVVVNRENTWATTLKLAELRSVLVKRPYAPLQTWNEIKPEWPTLTFVSIGPTGKSRGMDVLRDVVGEPDPAVSVEFVDEASVLSQVDRTFGALGLVSIRSASADYPRRKVTAIADGQGGAISPTRSAISEGKYPLSRPVYGYMNVGSPRLFFAHRFVTSALGKSELMDAAGYVSLSDEKRHEALQALTQRH